MNKKIVMSFVLLTLVGVSLAFAQAPTLDKLRFNNVTYGGQPAVAAGAVNKTISGAVVIPDTYNGRPMKITISSGFVDCTGITSVTFPNSMNRIDNVSFNGCSGLTSVSIPASIDVIGVRAFEGCTGLTSVTFLGSSVQMNSSSFDGDLPTKYRAGGSGVYTRPAGNNIWTRIGDAPVAPPPTPVINTSLNGIWDVGGGTLVTISGNTGVFSSSGTVSGLLQDAVNKNYYTSPCNIKQLLFLFYKLYRQQCRSCKIYSHYFRQRIRINKLKW